MADPVRLNNQIQFILTQFYLKKSLIENPISEPDPFDKDPPRDARSFRQSSSDVLGDSLQTARNIGDLTRGKTRLNVVSALTRDDNVDFFRFKVTKDGELGAAITTDKDLRVQLLSRRGEIIADSEAVSGSTKAENFQLLGAQKLKVTPDDYYLKVTRATSVQRSERPNYAIQLSMSRYYESDYDTIETPAARYAPASTTASSSASSLNSVLNQLGLGGLFDFKA